MRHLHLRCQDPELRDLAATTPELRDAVLGETGARLVRLLGVGGMSARFLSALGEPTDVPARSPNRGPPYWKSTVLRRKVLGDAA